MVNFIILYGNFFRKTNSKDDGPEDRVEKGVGGDLDVSFHEAMEHECQDTHQTADPDISFLLTVRKGTKAFLFFTMYLRSILHAIKLLL